VPKNWQEQELQLLNSFMEHHTHISIFKSEKETEEIPTFCGRERLLSNLTGFLLSADTGNWGYILTGESGSGKSAVFSKMFRILESKDCFVLAHSAGLSPGSGRVNDLLQIWNNQLRRLLGMALEPEDTDSEKVDHIKEAWDATPGERELTFSERLQEKFSELLGLASSRKRIVLLIDALDRFETTARAEYLSWLPSPMCKNVKALCTSVPGTEVKALQYHKGIIACNIDEFSKEEAAEMLTSLCRKQHKSLYPNAKRVILEKRRPDGKPAIISPLWLSLSVNTLVAMDNDDFEKISRYEGRGDQKIESYIVDLAEQFDPLPGTLFMNHLSKAGTVFGMPFTRAVFSYIAVSRSGLNEKDLEKLMPEKTWDPVMFANLRRWFRMHLVLQGEDKQWNLTHRILRQAIIEQLDEASLKTIHSNLANYLWTLPDDPERSSETLYHLISSGQLTLAAAYYGGILNEEDIRYSTDVLAWIMTKMDNGVDIVSSLPEKVVFDRIAFPGILERYIYNLDRVLERGGYLEQRMTIMERLYSAYVKIHGQYNIEQNLAYNMSALFEKLGSISCETGKLDVALRFFEKCSDTIQSLNTSDPTNNDFKLGLAISFERLAEIQKSLGNMEKALSLYRKRFSLAKELYDGNPQDERFMSHYAVSFGLLGSFYHLTGKVNEALDYLQEAAILNRELARRYPLKQYYDQGLSINYTTLGTLYQDMGHYDEAFNHFMESFTLCKKMYTANPGVESSRESLAIAYLNLGKIYYFKKQADAAFRSCYEASEIFQDLLKANPGKELIKSNLARTYCAIGEIRRDSGKINEALGLFQASYNLFKELSDSNAHAESWKNGLAVLCGYISEIYLLQGQPEEALKYSSVEVKILTGLRDSDTSNSMIKTNLADAYHSLGSANQSLKQLNEALRNFALSSSLYKELSSENVENPWFLHQFAVSLNCLGEINQSMGKLDEAYLYFDKRHLTSKNLAKSYPDNDIFRSGYGISSGKIGDLFLQKGLPEEAHKYFDEQARIFESLCVDYPQISDYRHYLSITYARLGDIHQAEENLDVAMDYFQKQHIICQELNESYPEKVKYLESYCISCYKLAAINRVAGDDEQGIRYFNLYRQITAYLVSNLPQVSKYKDWEKFEYVSMPASPYVANKVRTVITPTQKTQLSDVSEKAEPIYQLIESGEYQKALTLLTNEEAEIRERSVNSLEFQENIGKQATVLNKMGKHKEALRKLENQEEICARNGFEEQYVGSLISQAAILIEFLKNPKRAKALLNEAVAIARENNYAPLHQKAGKLLEQI
jgi:tetratricopeptide (TPR) repeat protein